jgi:hypothetical protein
MSVIREGKKACSDTGRGVDHNGKMLYSLRYLRREKKPTIGFEPTTY